MRTAHRRAFSAFEPLELPSRPSTEGLVEMPEHLNALRALHLRELLQRTTEPKLADHAAHRGHVSVRQGATISKPCSGFCVRRHHLAAGDEPIDTRDQRLRQLRQIGQRALLCRPLDSSHATASPAATFGLGSCR